MYRKMDRYFNAVLKIGKMIFFTEHRCGIARQGNNVVPTLFNIDMQLVAEGTIKHENINNLNIPSIECNYHSTRVLKL